MAGWVTTSETYYRCLKKLAETSLIPLRCIDALDESAHPYEGCSFFLVPPETEGVEIERAIPHLGSDMLDIGHAEYNDVRIPEENLLGERNAGFQIAQICLGSARLIHCMRYSGRATRAIEIAKAYMTERDAFGSSLVDKQA